MPWIFRESAETKINLEQMVNHLKETTLSILVD